MGKRGAWRTPDLLAVVWQARRVPQARSGTVHEVAVCGTHRLRATLSVAGPNTLTLKLTETNAGKTPYESAFGVHPYFAVADACEVAIDGERLPKPWVIREFSADGKGHKLQDCAGKVTFSVMSSGNDTWCVWNPGIERTPLCETLGPEEWRSFYCLEPFMRRPSPLASGESREHVVRIVVSGL